MHTVRCGSPQWLTRQIFGLAPAALPCSVLLLAAFAQAQTPTPSAQQAPDAGRVQREQAPAPARAQPPAPARERIPGQSAGETFSADPTPLPLKSLRFRGNTVVSSTDAQAAFAAALNATPTTLPATVRLGQLQAGAAAVAALYKTQGYLLARVILPQNALSADGELQLQVLEGQLEDIDVPAGNTPQTAASQTAALQAAARQTLAAAGVQAGQPVRQEPLERALLIMEERGLGEATAGFGPGAAVGTTRLTVRGLNLATAPRFNIGTDNHGSRFTGSGRLFADAELPHLAVLGDAISIRASTSSGGKHASGQSGNTTALVGSYSLPLGHQGSRAGFQASAVNYDVGGPFASLKANGKAQLIAASLRHPLSLAQGSSWWADANLSRRTSTDDNFAGNSADKAANIIQLGASYSANTAASSQRLNLQWVSGKLNLSANALQAAADAATAQTQGRYSKLRADGLYAQALDTGALQLRLSTQLAQKNLDSAEKFSLGGPSGVRAWAQGEASGDSGWLASAEWQLPAQNWAGIQAGPALFIDSGQVTQHKTAWAGALAAGQSNTVGLSGAGISSQLRHDKLPGARASLSIAWPLGSNPLASVPANSPAGTPALGSDAREKGPRAWLSLNWAL